MGLSEVSTILWRERHLLELLVYKLDSQRLLLGSGNDRFLVHVSEELEQVLDELRHTELARAVEVEAVAAELGLGPDPSLAQLAEAAPPPWGDLLLQHRDALLTLAAEVRERSRHNSEALGRGAAAVRDLVTNATSLTGAAGRHDDDTSGILVDRMI